MKVQAGDIVHVRGVVSRTDSDGDVAFTSVTKCGGEITNWCRPDQIVHIEPRPLQVGDWVRTRYGFGEVRAIEDGAAWVKCDDTGHHTWSVSQLERA